MPEKDVLVQLVEDLQCVLSVGEPEGIQEQLAAAERETAAESRLLAAHGSIEQAVIAAGARIAKRAEEIAGITEEEIRVRFRARVVQTSAAVAQAKTVGIPAITSFAVASLSDLMHGHNEETQQDLRRLADGYQAAAAEHRSFGGTLKFHSSSSSKAKKSFQEIAELFPTDWLNASNEHRALLATETKVRAHYADVHIRPGVTQRVSQHVLLPEEEARVDEPSPAGQWVKTDRTGNLGRANPDTGKYEILTLPVYERLDFEVIWPGETFRAKKDGTPYGSGWEQWVHPVDGSVCWRKPAERKSVGPDAGEKVSQILVSSHSPLIEGRSASFATAAHEFSHRSEASVKVIAGLEKEFLHRRTLTVEDPDRPGVMKQEEPVRLFAGKDEWARPDHFAAAYMGKEYKGSYTEILSMGMESLFAGSHGGLIGVNSHQADPEMRNFILGTLVTAGRRH